MTTIYVYHYTRDHSVYCVFKTTLDVERDLLYCSIFTINDKMLPYFDNKTPLYPEAAASLIEISDFTIEPWYSAIQRPPDGEKFYEYPNLL